MSAELFFFQKNHKKVKRNFIHRMNNNKIKCMKIAKKYGIEYWDGNRKYGYGGYKYIPGRLNRIAKSIIKKFKLKNNSKILDVGCGKGFLLYEIKRLLPGCQITGIDISSYAIRNSHRKIKKNLIKFNAISKLPYKKKQFDLAVSFGLFHNFTINQLENSIQEFTRVAKKNYLMVESYRNNKELFNLQCWALTCDSFFRPIEWKWLFKKFNYKGSYEFIYFN